MTVQIVSENPKIPPFKDNTVPEKTMTVDGDKLLEFIKAVQDIGKMLENISIGPIAECFEKGKVIKEVDDIIEIKTKWAKALDKIVESLRSSALQKDALVADWQQITTSIRNLQAVVDSPKNLQMIATMRQLVELLKEFKKLKEDGTLGMILSLNEVQPPTENRA